MKRYRLKKNESLKPFLVMLFIMILCAVILGYFGTRYIVYPVFINSNTEKKDIGNGNSENKVMPTDTQSTITNEQASEQISAIKEKEFYIYHIQLGNFSAEENAKALINELSEKNIYTYILNDKGYKVVTTPIADYDDAVSIRETMRIYAKDSFVLKRKVYVENVSVQNTINNILNDLYEAHTEPSVINEAWLLKLKGAFQDGFGDSQLSSDTIQTFQSIYDEVDKIKNYQGNGLLDLEEVIIMKLEKII